MAHAGLAQDTVNGHERYRRSKSLRSQVDDWLDLIERLKPAAADAEPSVDPAHSSGDRRASVGQAGARAPDLVERAPAARPSVVVGGAEAPGERVVLVRDGERFRHLGTVMPRSAAAPPLIAYLETGLTGEQAAALEFVASWFGAPFDAVNTVDDRASHRLSWGIWSFAGRGLARCLAGWKQRAPQAFDALLVRYGIDVAVQPDGASAITVIPPRGDDVLGGQPAIDVIARNAALVAALARAGRDSTAQLAQIACVAAGVPALLALPLREGGPSVGDVAKSARAVAVMLFLGRVFGRRGTARLVRALGTPPTPVEDESAALSALVDRLEDVDGLSAHHVLRILSSPELDSRC